MGTWDSKALGLWHDSATPVTANNLQGMDFLISKTGSNFILGDCNVAYSMKIPFGLFFEANPEFYDQCPINDFNRWPSLAVDPTIKMLDSYIMTGSMKRAIHFIIMDCSKNINSYGKTITSSWIVTTGRRLLDLMWQRYKLPTFVYMNQNPVVTAEDPISKEQINLFLDDNGEGLSTYTKALLDADGYPADGTKPKLPYDGGKLWGFWLYNPVSSGIKTIYGKDKSGLYADLNYVAPTTTTTNTTGTSASSTNTTTPSTTTTSVDLVPLMTKLDTMSAKLDDISAKVEADFNYLTTHLK